MSSVTPAAEGSKEDDILWNLVKNNEFLKYEHSIEQIKPSRLDFPVVTKRTENDTTFSNFGQEIIKEYLHIGLVNEGLINGHLKRRVLLLVWPKFVSPECYQKHKLYLVGLKKIKTMVFRVPEEVFQKYSEGNNRMHKIVAATAILAPVEEWKFLERAVISSFYHLTFDKATSDLLGDSGVWQNYSKDNLDKEWNQLLFICCGPQGLAYLFKRMLKRNWARIAKISVSNHVECDGYSAFCTGGVTKLVVEWAKLFFKPDGVMKFLEELNIIKPALSTNEIVNKVNVSFDEYMFSSKKYRCNVCPYNTNIRSHLADHMRTHTGETPFICDICGSAHRKADTLKNHKIKHHTGNYPYHCNFCGKPFIERNDMKFHVTVHERKGDIHFQCYKCSHIVKDETRLVEHMITHSKDPSFRCTECGRKCDSETALVAHSRNHSKDKPFYCHICKKGFLFEHVLNRHYTTHSDSRPVFTCHICNKSLATPHSLRTHMAAQHGEEK